MNILRRGDLAKALSQGRRELDKITREISGADSEPVKAAATVLAKEARRLLNVPGGRDSPSSPGEAPRRRTKKLRKSIGHAVVEGVRRVGSGSFEARLFEFGGYKDRGGEPQPPRPFFRVALENVKDQMVDVMVSAAQQKIAKGGR